MLRQRLFAQSSPHCGKFEVQGGMFRTDCRSVYRPPTTTNATPAEYHRFFSSVREGDGRPPNKFPLQRPQPPRRPVPGASFASILCEAPRLLAFQETFLADAPGIRFFCFTWISPSTTWETHCMCEKTSPTSPSVRDSVSR